MSGTKCLSLIFRNHLREHFQFPDGNCSLTNSNSSYICCVVFACHHSSYYYAGSVFIRNGEEGKHISSDFLFIYFYFIYLFFILFIYFIFIFFILGRAPWTMQGYNSARQSPDGSAQGSSSARSPPIRSPTSPLLDHVRRMQI